jgi:UDP-N-acetyl-D-glucosamine dehydrogenase
MGTKKLIEKLEDKNAIVAIIGLGYVGLPLILRYIESGYKVIGLDVDNEKIDLINDGKSYIKHIPSSKISEAIEAGLRATSDFSVISEVDALIICVPTPLNSFREPDLQYIISSFESSLPFIKKGQIISLVSTTYPGTTEEEMFPRLKALGFDVGKDIFLTYSPEREDPGNENFETRTIPKIVGGYSENCLAVGVALFKHVIDEVIPVSSLKVAEITKLLENIYRAVNIGLVNDIKKITDKMDIDIFEVIAAASTKPFGFKPFYPGPGLGGHCIPIDPFYLSWKAKEYGLYSHFIELAGEINSDMPHWVISKVNDSLNMHAKSIKGSRILILGLAYKKNVDDMRESPSISILKILKDKGAEVSYSDPYIPTYHLESEAEPLVSQDISRDMLSKFDAILVVTDHDSYDYDLILESSSLIVDTRGVYSDEFDNVFRA